MSDISMVQKPSQLISKTFVSNEYNLYLHGEISHDADEYLEHFAVYHQAGPEDLIRLWIQSPGGSVSVGHQYIQHMNRCGATIVAVIGMGTASEGTAICLAADDWEVDEMSTFLVHGFSYGTYGHEAQVYNTATFNKKLNERSLRNTYSGFLKEEEILEALKGVDLLFDGDELMERLQSFKEYRASQPCNCGQADCPKNAQLQALAEMEEEEGFDEMPSLSEIIADAVELGVKKALAARDAKERNATRTKSTKVVEKSE
jgi:ATP-dependent protease ClpP protease subunit